MKFASCSARRTRHSLPGSSKRAATSARHPWPEAAARSLGTSPKGMPYRRRKPAYACSERAGSKRARASSVTSSRSPIGTSRQRS